MFVCQQCHDTKRKPLKCKLSFESHRFRIYGSCNICGHFSECGDCTINDQQQTVPIVSHQLITVSMTFNMIIHAKETKGHLLERIRKEVPKDWLFLDAHLVK